MPHHVINYTLLSNIWSAFVITVGIKPLFMSLKRSLIPINTTWKERTRGNYPSFNIYIFFEAPQQTLTWQAVGTLKSSSLAEGWQEFHLHTTRFEPGRVLEWTIPVSHHPSGSILHFSFEAPSTHQLFIFLLILLLMPNVVKSHAKVEKLSKM